MLLKGIKLDIRIVFAPKVNLRFRGNIAFGYCIAARSRQTLGHISGQHIDAPVPAAPIAVHSFDCFYVRNTAPPRPQVKVDLHLSSR
jgi:hypothetical protein